MSLAAVPPPVGKQPVPGLWVKISISLIVVGALALALACVLGVRWYYGLDRLHSSATDASVTTIVGRTYLIDEMVGVTSGTPLVDVRNVSVRYGTNTAGVVADVRLCRLGQSPCLASQPFEPGKINLSVERILVRVVPTRAGVIVVKGVTIAYRQGIRRATQRLGSTVTMRVTPAS